MGSHSTALGPHDRPPLGRWIPLSFQHVFAMFGATILVPLLTGLSSSTALFTAGTGTLIYILLTGAKVPIYLGSSFAFIPPLIAISQTYGTAYAMGGAIFAGLFYCLIAAIVYFSGRGWIDKALPPVVIGSVIVVIGMSLAPTAISEAGIAAGDGYSLVHGSIALVTLAIAIVATIFLKGFFNTLAILIGLVGGYLFTLVMGFAFPSYRIIDFSVVRDAAWLGLPFLHREGGSYVWLAPRFNLVAVLTFVIVSVSTICEHLGDVLTASKVVGRNFYEDPGLHRTLLGDGLATAWAALWGGPPNTTYGENIGVMAITKVYSVWVIGGAAVIAVLLSFCQKFGAIIQTIPTPVLGGICILLYGLISSSGLRTLVEGGVDYQNKRNLTISSVILVIGIGGGILQFKAGSFNFSLGSVALATVAGIVLNLVIPADNKGKTK